MTITETSPNNSGTTSLDNRIVLTTASEKKAVSLDAVSQFAALASIKAPARVVEEKKDEEKKERAPLVVVAVVDKSGSMGGVKMEQTIETLKCLIGEMGPRDQFALVAYDSSVCTEFPLSKMHDSAKEMALLKSSKLRAGTSTNLSGGFERGLRLIPKDIPDNTVSAIFLMTDGLANLGITSSAGLIEMMKSTITELGIRCLTHTFGYGSDHNATLLREVAQGCGGSYYFIETNDKLKETFAECFGGLVSTVAQQIRLTCKAADGVKISKVLTMRPVETILEGKEYRVDLGDIQAEEQRDIPVLVNLDKIEVASQEAQAVVTFDLSYYNVLDEQMQKSNAEAVVLRKPQDQLTPEDEKANAEVIKHKTRIESVQALNEAIKQADKGNFAEAKRIVREQKKHTEDVFSGFSFLADQEAQGCLESLALAESNLESKSKYSDKGSAHINNYIHVMSYQRACGNGYYQTSDQSNMQSAWKS